MQIIRSHTATWPRSHKIGSKSALEDLHDLYDLYDLMMICSRCETVLNKQDTSTHIKKIYTKTCHTPVRSLPYLFVGTKQINLCSRCFTTTPEYVRYCSKLVIITIRPMTMETRCCKVFFANYLKKGIGWRYSRTAATGQTATFLSFFSGYCSRCCTRWNLRFHVENCQHADQKQPTRR